MQVRVLFFALLRDKAGTAQAELELPPGATASDAVAEIGRRFSEVRPLLPSTACAVNRAYAQPETLLHDGDEVALIPPVSGG